MLFNSIAFAEYCFDEMARPSHLIEFSDYREIAPDVWWPFRERETFSLPSRKTRGLFVYWRSDRTVSEVSTKQRDLAEEWKQRREEIQCRALHVLARAQGIVCQRIGHARDAHGVGILRSLAGRPPIRGSARPEAGAGYSIPGRGGDILLGGRWLGR